MIKGIKTFGAVSVIFAIFLLSVLVPDYLRTGELRMYDAAYFITSLCWLVFGVGVIRRISWARIGLIILALIYIVDTLEYPSKLYAALRDYGKVALIIPTLGLLYFISVVVLFTRPSVKKYFENRQHK